jgi:hypothetical protein
MNVLRNLLREYDTDCPRAIFQMTIATVIAFRENELRSTRLGLAGRVLRALNFSVALGSDDKSGINQNHSAASASLSGDRQPVTGIQAKVTKSPLSAACLRPGNHISDQVFGASVDASPTQDGNLSLSNSCRSDVGSSLATNGPCASRRVPSV